MDNTIKVTQLPSGILHLSLNRPEQLNALNQELLQHFSHLLDEAKRDKSVKAILLTGEGKAFCAGADIKQLATLDGPKGLAFARAGQEIFSKLELLGKPSLAAIHGVALGGGCELAMAATLRIATNNAIFGQPEVKLGVIPGFGGTQRLPRLIGKGRALELCLTGKRFNANEALQWGFLSEITKPDELRERAIQLLAEIIKLSSIALQSVITTINEGYDLSLSDAVELEAAHFALCCTTADKREGVSAFLEKREATFSGE